MTLRPNTAGQSDRLRLKKADQRDRFKSPWSRWERLGMLAWLIVDRVLCRYTPKCLNPWRLFWLRIFGCRVSGRPFVHPKCIIKIPWQLVLEDRAAIGPYSEVYNLGTVILRERCTVSQYAYLCGGSHDIDRPDLPLLIGDIEVGNEAFVGAKALILPGVVINAGAVIGAGSVVSRDAPEWMVCAGNPCRPLRERTRFPQSNKASTGNGKA